MRRRSFGKSSIALSRSPALILSAWPGTCTNARDIIVSAASTMGSPVIPSHPTVLTSTVPSCISLTIEMMPVSTKYAWVMRVLASWIDIPLDRSTRVSMGRIRSSSRRGSAASSQLRWATS